MPEGPVEERGSRAAPERVAPAGPEEGPVPFPQFRGEVPHVVVKADLLPALSLLSSVSLLGFPLAWLWAHLAPAQESTVTSSGTLVPLLVESYHQFDALAIFLLLSSAIGVLTGAAAWMLRGRRGPVVLVGAVLGSIIAAWLGMQLGASFAAGVYPMATAPKAGDLIALAPEVGTLWAVLVQPLAVALVYGLAASWNGMDDLGRRLS